MIHNIFDHEIDPGMVASRSSHIQKSNVHDTTTGVKGSVRLQRILNEKEYDKNQSMRQGI